MRIVELLAQSSGLDACEIVRLLEPAPERGAPKPIIQPAIRPVTKGV